MRGAAGLLGNAKTEGAGSAALARGHEPPPTTAAPPGERASPRGGLRRPDRRPRRPAPTGPARAPAGPGRRGPARPPPPSPLSGTPTACPATKHPAREKPRAVREQEPRTAPWERRRGAGSGAPTESPRTPTRAAPRQWRIHALPKTALWRRPPEPTALALTKRLLNSCMPFFFAPKGARERSAQAHP